MRKAVILVGLFLTLSVGQANAEQSNSLRCLVGLDAISSEISSSRADLSPKLARGLYGNLLMSVNDNGRSVSPKDLPPGSPSDAKYCMGENVDQASLGVLLKAYLGYLSDDPYAEFAQCFAGFINVAAEIEREYGTNAGYEFGFMAGKKLGAQFTALNYLYSMSGPSVQAIQQMGAKILEEISNASETDRARHIETYLDVCDWYGVPIRGMYNGAITLGPK